jgi:urease accessory protein
VHATSSADALVSEPARPQLDVAAARHPSAGTHLAHRRIRWPYALTSSFRLDAAPADMLTLIVQSASGALVGGDRVRQRIEVGPGAALHVTTPAATAVHGMPDGVRAEETAEITVGAGAFVEHLPEPRVLFPGADLVQRLLIDIDPSAAAILGDGFLTHDPAARSGGAALPDGRPPLMSGTVGFRRLVAETIVRTGALVRVADRVDITGAALAGSPWSAHGWIAVLCSPERLDTAAAVAELEAALAPIDSLYAGASALPLDSGIGLRLAARDGEALRRGLEAGWATARRLLTGRLPGSRRKGGRHGPGASSCR